VFKPSLETVERSVATKVYLENHYYGILKRPRDRDQRKAALEKELLAAGAEMSDAQRRGIRAAWAASETEHLRDLRARVGANSFLKVKTIGHGAFGVVSLVREKGSGELFAMKQLRKADMLRKGQEGHVRAERDVMSAASSTAASRWIVRLVYSFQDVDHLYLVMEYMGGGDLLNLLIEKDIFEESFAKFYIAEMVLAVQEAHKLGYIHRDIKVG
jgi:serine/threonine protein kinase